MVVLRCPSDLHDTSAKKVADTRQHSRLVVDGLKQTGARAMLRAVGFGDADFDKPQIGVASTWARLTPCIMHIRELAAETVAGVDGAGGESVLFHTITVSDGISMGSPGMRYSLVSREVIADSIETVVAAEGFDGVVATGGCDKNMPDCAMAIARLNRPGVFVYGGSIRPGARRPDIVTVFEAIGARAAVKSTMRSCARSSSPPSRARTAAAESTPRIPWPPPSRRLDCRCLTAPRRKPSVKPNAATAAALEGRRASARGGHLPGGHPHAQGLRECHHSDDCAQWLNQRRAASAGDRARRARQAAPV